MMPALQGRGREHRSTYAVGCAALLIMVATLSTGCRHSPSIVGVWHSTKVHGGRSEITYTFDRNGHYSWTTEVSSPGRIQSIHTEVEGTYQLSGSKLVLQKVTFDSEIKNADGTTNRSKYDHTNAPEQLVYPQVGISTDTLSLGLLNGDATEFPQPLLHRLN